MLQGKEKIGVGAFGKQRRGGDQMEREKKTKVCRECFWGVDSQDILCSAPEEVNDTNPFSHSYFYKFNLATFVKKQTKNMFEIVSAFLSI